MTAQNCTTHSPRVQLCWHKEINPTSKHSLPLCANSWRLLCAYTLPLFFFFFPFPCAQFTCFHSNSECTLLTWAGCRRLSHTEGVLQSKPQWSVCSVQASLPLMMTNVVQEAWRCNCNKDHLPLIHWFCKTKNQQHMFPACLLLDMFGGYLEWQWNI